MNSDWSPFSYLVINLARQIRPNERAFSGVNSTLPMLACLLAKRAYDFHFTYLNVAGGVEPVPKKIPHSSSDPAIVTGSPAIFANEDFYDLCARGALDLFVVRAERGLRQESRGLRGRHRRVRRRRRGGCSHQQKTRPTS